MASKSKTKGSSWERDVAKLLTDLYDETFLRIPTSGAFLGGVNNHRTSSLDQSQIGSRRGDIQCPYDWKHANIEAKNYQDLSFHQLIQQECKQMDIWIDQTLEVAKSDDINIIFFKITRKGSYVAVQDFPYLDKDRSLQYKDWFIFELQLYFDQNKTPFKNACIKGMMNY